MEFYVGLGIVFTCIIVTLIPMHIKQTCKLNKNGCLFLRGACFHGVLINTCNFLVACSCVGVD